MKEINFAKLISEKECLSLINPNISEQDIKDIFLNRVFGDLINLLSKDIFNAKLNSAHLYRFEVRVHAQENKDHVNEKS